MQVAGSQHSEVLSQFLPSIHSDLSPLREVIHPCDSGAYNVSILEGNASLARLLATGFAAESMKVRIHADVASALQEIETACPDLLIVDIDIEDVGGPVLIATLRSMQPTLRILVLSGHAGLERGVEALNRGADDYLVKPFSLLEMIARVRALRRRSGELIHLSKPSKGQLILQKNQSRVSLSGRTIELTPRECELLEFMMAHPDTTLSRATLSQKVWNLPDESNTNIVDVYVKYLRDKLESTFQRKLIRTVRGVGYVFQQQS